MLTIPFRDVPLGSVFFDPWGSWCVKTSSTGARDDWCAPGFELGFDPDSMVRLPVQRPDDGQILLSRSYRP